MSQFDTVKPSGLTRKSFATLVHPWKHKEGEDSFEDSHCGLMAFPLQGANRGAAACR
jgi:hypothetical protein